MIVHRDDLYGIAPDGGAPVLIASDVRPAVLRREAMARKRAGWRFLEVRPCAACSATGTAVAS